MAEKIKIAEFDIDVDQLIEATTEVKSRIDQLVQSQKILTQNGKTSSEQFVTNAANLRELRREYNSQIKVLGEVNAATGKNIPLEHEINEILNREIKSINDLRKQTNDLTKARNNINITTEEGRKQLESLNSKLDENRKLEKENVSQFEQTKLNIGNYTESIKQAVGEMGLFGGASKEVNTIMEGLKSLFKASGKDIQNLGIAFDVAANANQRVVAGLKILRVALLATGIGAILVALGAMITYLNTTREGVDRLNRVLTPLKTVLGGLLGVIQDVGAALLDAFKNPRQFIDNLVDALRPLGTMLEGILTLDWSKMQEGYSGIKDQIQGAVDATKELWAAGQEIQALNERINESELNMIENQGRLNRQLEEQREISRDASRTSAERNKAAQEAIRLANELKDIEIGHLDLKIERLKMQQSISGNTFEDDKELAQLQADRENREASHSRLMSRLTNRLNQNKDKGQKSQENADKKRIQALNEELELMKAQEDYTVKSSVERLNLEQRYADKSLEILKAELDAKLISQRKYETEVLNIQRSLAQSQAEISLEEIDRELRDIERRVDIERSLSEAVGLARIEEEENRAKELREARALYEAERFENGLSTELEYQEAIKDINAEFTKTQVDLARDRDELLREIAREQRELDFESEILAIEERGARMFELEELRIQQQRELAIEDARMRYENEAMLQQAIANINTEASNAIQQLNIERDNVILDSKQSLLTNIASLLGEETLLGKAAAIAAATINTYQGATKALATLPPPASFIAAAATTAQGLATVGRITGISGNIKAPKFNANRTEVKQSETIFLNAIPPFATGGKVTGGIPINRSNGDNILATLKLGEVVLNENQQRALGGDSIFRAIGVPGFATGGRVGEIQNVQRIATSSNDQLFFENVANAVRLGSRQGTEVGSRQGISDVQTETYLRSLTIY